MWNNSQLYAEKIDLVLSIIIHQCFYSTCARVHTGRIPKVLSTYDLVFFFFAAISTRLQYSTRAKELKFVLFSFVQSSRRDSFNGTEGEFMILLKDNEIKNAFHQKLIDYTVNLLKKSFHATNSIWAIRSNENFICNLISVRKYLLRYLLKKPQMKHYGI